MDKRFSTVKTSTGNFDVYWNGALTVWRIVNGSLGMSGTGRNMYGILKVGGAPRWVGPLVTCKSIIAFTLAKEAKGVS